MITVRIRPIAAEDLAIVEERIAFDWAAPEKHSERFTRQEKGEAVYLVAWNGNLPVGHLLLKWRGTADDPLAPDIEDCPDLEDLFVIPDYRSNGIGTRLLECAEQTAVERGNTRIGLGVGVDNPRARRFYLRLGYRETGTGRYETGGVYIDRDGSERSWTEVCVYLTKYLM
ncbi:MAG: GNAT family N-acetyltransferase [Chloroflexi bacterium]|nr:GNAT family N-acetyltransferase [Chloroflexota bacterium]